MGLAAAQPGPLARCSSCNYTKWALWQTVGANGRAGHCGGRGQPAPTQDGRAKLSREEKFGRGKMGVSQLPHAGRAPRLLMPPCAMPPVSER